MDARTRPNPRGGRLVLAVLLAALVLPGVVATPAAAATPASRPFRDCPDCPELVRIAPGRFLMGSTESEGAASRLRPERAAAERPQHEVTIAPPFAIGRFEVTVKQFAEFAKDSGRDYATCSGLAEVPVWTPESAAACRQLNAGDASFSAVRGPTWPTFACNDGFAATAPVGRFPANRLGIHDMFGNLAEFVADCFTPSHAGAPVDGSARTDATGCAIRVVKGASWAAEPGSLRPAVRQGIPRNLRGDGHGLRVVRELETEVKPK